MRQWSASKESAMRRIDRQFIRFAIVLALGAGLAALAYRPKSAETLSRAQSAPFVAAIAMEVPVAEHCLRSSRDRQDSKPIGDKSASHAKNKIIACG
jgi:hypothetical protein